MTAKSTPKSNSTPYIIGYLRVSTEKQDINNNKLEILKLANEKGLVNVNFLEEKVSGRVDWRKRVLGKEFEKLKAGDIIIMSEYSRIGRNMMQSLEFIAECRRKGVILYSTIGDIPGEEDPTGNLIMALNGWKAQMERDQISYRTKIALAARKERGVILGRPRKMKLDKDPENKQRIKDMLDSGLKQWAIAAEFKCSEVTLSKYIKLHNLKDKELNQEKLEVIAEEIE